LALSAKSLTTAGCGVPLRGAYSLILSNNPAAAGIVPAVKIFGNFGHTHGIDTRRNITNAKRLFEAN
jgi:hypothetical protein